MKLSLVKIFEQIKQKKDLNIENDLNLLSRQFGMNPGKGQYFNNKKLLLRIQQKFPITKIPKILYRGVGIQAGTKKYQPKFRPDYVYRNDKKYYDRKQNELNDIKNIETTKKFRGKSITEFAKGIRSWTSNKSDAKFYMKGDINFLFVWKLPPKDQIYLSSNDINKKYNFGGGLDSNEYISEFKGNSIINVIHDYRNVDRFAGYESGDYFIVEIS
jgi:hypothetical protein